MPLRPHSSSGLGHLTSRVKQLLPCLHMDHHYMAKKKQHFRAAILPMVRVRHGRLNYLQSCGLCGSCRGVWETLFIAEMALTPSWRPLWCPGCGRWGSTAWTFRWGTESCGPSWVLGRTLWTKAGRGRSTAARSLQEGRREGRIWIRGFFTQQHQADHVRSAPTTEVQQMRVEERLAVEPLDVQDGGAFQAAAHSLLGAALVRDERLQHGPHHVQLQDKPPSFKWQCL